MALAIDASTPVYKATTTVSVSTLTTASFTPPNGSLLVVLYANANVVAAMNKPTNTGGAVTWDAAVHVSEGVNNTSAAVWLGLVTTSASMTVTVTNAGTFDWGFGTVVVTGQAATQNGATGVATSTSGAPSATTSALVGSNSLILGAVANFSNGTLPTVPGGQSTTFNGNAYSFQDGTNGAAWCQFLTGMNLGSGSTATINDTAPTIDYSMAIAEILAGAVVGPVSQPQRMPLGL